MSLNANIVTFYNYVKDFLISKIILFKIVKIVVSFRNKKEERLYNNIFNVNANK